jgi:serine/threonine-protein kinase RsbW/stage II sporulation protein AB (anti-sigma F factor)
LQGNVFSDAQAAGPIYVQLADSPTGSPLELELPVDRASVAKARRAVGDFAESAGAVRSDVELATSEAVSNSVVHAYPDGGPGTIRIRGELSDEALRVTISDDGSGLRPNLASKGLGLGLPLIARLSEDYRLEDGSNGGAVVTMSFRRIRR